MGDIDTETVNLLRDRIRCQAEDLLKLCETRSTKSRTTPPRNHAAIEEEEKKDDGLGGGRAKTTTTSSTPELTKRLQRMALDRDQQRDRLRVIQADTESHLSSCKTFDELRLPSFLLKAIYELGFDRPSAIQEETLPRIMKGRNVIGQAPSGSGKTAAFCIGMLVRQSGICVCPTRELAIQVVEQALQPLAKYMSNVRIQLVVSGSMLEKNCGDIYVGTPGKIVDSIKRKLIDVKSCKTFVLDEADHMVDSFRANCLLIKKALPRDCQYLLFSATFPPLVVDFLSKLTTHADQILMDNDEALVLDVIKQVAIDTRSYPGGKILFLADIYGFMTIAQSIVFVETRAQADLVHSTLTNSGYVCSVLHSGLETEERDAVMKDFRNNKSTVLITTNVLARGVDVDNVCLVINYDLPVDKDGFADCETWLHRVGRTGRFGRKGTAINLIDSDTSARALEMITDHFAKPGMITTIEPDPEALAEAIEI